MATNMEENTIPEEIPEESRESEAISPKHNDDLAETDGYEQSDDDGSASLNHKAHVTLRKTANKEAEPHA